MNNEQKDNVMVLKMITGEKIVTEIDQENSTNDYIVIKRPLQLYSAQDVDSSTGETVHYNYFHQWNQLTDEEVFFLPYMHIVTVNKASESVKKFFDKSSAMFYDSENESGEEDTDFLTQSTGEDDSYETINMSEDDAHEFILKNFSANNAVMN